MQLTCNGHVRVSESKQWDDHFNMFKVMMKCSIKKIVLSSSATIYGNPEYLLLDENHPTGK